MSLKWIFQELAKGVIAMKQCSSFFVFSLGIALLLTFTIFPVRASAGLSSGSKGVREFKLVLPPPTSNNVDRKSSSRGVSSTFTVTSTANSGSGTLRQAILDANASLGADVIDFAIASEYPNSVETIVLASDLPVITDEVFIDGWSQGDGSYSGTPLIKLDGASVIGGIGLNIQASNSIVRGLSIVSFQQFSDFGGNGVGIGIFGSGTRNVWIYGNHVGVDPSGNTDLGNAQIGIWIGSDANANLIGTNADETNDSSERNIISGNDFGSGILIQSDSNVVAGNYIGTDHEGSFAIQNDFNGVQIQGGSYNIVGGSWYVTRNLLSGNAWDGVQISNSGSGNIVRGNYIGTDVDGTSSIPNGSNGVELLNSGENNLIGGSISSERNVISGNDAFNQDWGILILNSPNNLVKGNYIGVDATGITSLGNGAGVVILGTSSGNVIGGSVAGEGNVISGSTGYYSDAIDANGLIIAGSGTASNSVIGNYIGTDASGNSAASNSQSGIGLLEGTTANIIGGNSTISQGNIISGNSSSGIHIDGESTSGNYIRGNRIGVNAAGNDNLSNSEDGIHVANGAHDNVIGGTSSGEGNVISGNGANGIGFSSAGAGNIVSGNLIGLDPAGTGSLGNLIGVDINSTSGTLIDGTTSSNFISGNGGGIYIYGEGSSSNIISGNRIGQDIYGATLANSGHGVTIDGVTGNSIGTLSPSGGNVISGNGGYGVKIIGAGATGNFVYRNLIGVDRFGTGVQANGLDGIHVANAGSTTIQENTVSGHGASGISLSLPGTSGTVIKGNFIGTNSLGTAPLGNTYGITLDSVSGCRVGGSAIADCNIISGNYIGMYIHSGSTLNVVKNNYIGTNASGMAALGNVLGIDLESRAHGNTIGGSLPGEGNVISGNPFAAIQAAGPSYNNLFYGNFVGTDATGTLAIPNGMGFFIIDSPNNRIGSYYGSTGNIISGNLGDGVSLWNSLTTGTRIYGNMIGVQADGVSPLGNSAGTYGGGIAMRNWTSNNTIGGTDEGKAPNTIAYNSPVGIVAYSGSQNRISGNSIFANTGLGIDFGQDGPTPNDPLDSDEGTNEYQNYPVIELAASDLEILAGSLNSTPSTSFRLEFFLSPVQDPSGHGEGQTYLGESYVTTDGDGNATFFESFPGQLTVGQFVTATATDPSGNTSEFSAAALVQPRVKVFGDHYVINTTLSGVPLHWPSGQANYALSNSIPTGFVPAITSAFATWDALNPITYSSGGGTPSSDWGGLPDGINNVVWLATDWETTTGADQNTIAVTRVRYNALNGEMTDVDIAFDAEHFTWDTSDDTASSNMNVQNVATHEAGHFSGLGDIYNPTQAGYVSFMGSDNESVSMFGYIRSGEFKKNDLDPADSAGVEYIYSNLPHDRMDLVLVFDGSASYAATYNALTPSKNGAIELVNKLREGDRVGVVRLPNVIALPLMEITDQASRNSAIGSISSVGSGGKCALGTGLLTAEAMLDGATAMANHGKAMILFSAGEEDTLPSALGSLPALETAGTRLFTMGFNGSSGQTLNDSMASKTGGAYFLASDVTIGSIVNQIWNRLLGQQSLAETVVASNNVPGFPQPGLRWQGAVDPGTGAIEPGLRWQGSEFILTLISPSNIVIDSAVAAANPSDGIEFFSGPTFNFFRIQNPEPGIWTLSVQGRVYPLLPEPLDLYIIASTDLTMDVAFNKGIYTPGEPIEVQTTLMRGGTTAGDVHVVGGEAVEDASVSAEVFVPNSGVAETISLSHLGAGVYKGSFTNTGNPGSYKFDVHASKLDEFNRQLTQSVFVAGPFICPPSIITNAAPGQCSAIVTFAPTLGDPIAFPGVTVTCTPPSGSTFPVGTTTVTCIGGDNLGRRDTCTFTVTVIDNQPPVISGASATPNSLSPPNHQMITVTVPYTTSDNCGPVTCALSVASNEPINGLGDGDTAPDWVVVNAHKVKLRSERSGKGNGRVYTITITCTDPSGNRSTKKVLVHVPKGKRCEPIVERRDGYGIIPKEYLLVQNYPNPFNPVTGIEFALPAESHVTMKVFNVLGQHVGTLVEETLESGYKIVEFDASALPSGIYFYRLEATSIENPEMSFTQVRKMMLLK